MKLKGVFLIGMVGLNCLIAQPASAQVVLVTLSLDKNPIAVGETTTLRVNAQVDPSIPTEIDRIFSWYVDVLNSSGSVATADYNAMEKTASDNDPQTSSTGIPDGAHRRGIYDTFINQLGAGTDAPVELIAIPVTGQVNGTSTFRVQAGTLVPSLSADFLVAPEGGGDPLIGGDYSQATLQLQVGGSVSDPELELDQPVFEPADGQNRITIQFPVAAGFDHFVEFKDLLGTGAWQTLPNGPHNSGSVEDVNQVPNRFYRVRLEPTN
jgi:hypothetical protein